MLQLKILSLIIVVQLSTEVLLIFSLEGYCRLQKRKISVYLLESFDYYQMSNSIFRPTRYILNLSNKGSIKFWQNQHQLCSILKTIDLRRLSSDVARILYAKILLNIA